MDWFKDAKGFKEASGYEVDGKWYPRVTKILGIKAKPALLHYYGEAESYKKAQAQTERSAEEGTLVHELVQAIMVGGKPEIDETVAPAVNEAVRFLEKHNIQIDPDSIEKRVVNYNQRYAGTIDGLALIGGKFGVLDIKTSQAIYRDYDLQTAAYMDPLSVDYPNLSTRWILRIDQQKLCQRCNAGLRPKGGREKIIRPKFTPGMKKACPVDEHEWSELKGIVELKESPFWKRDYEAFLSAKRLWEWESDFWLRKVGYLKNL